MKQGFFTKKETESKSRPDGKTYSCVSCGLHKNTDNPKQKPKGNFKKEIMVIGESPKNNRYLKNILDKFNIDLFEDCININALSCKTEKNKFPDNYQIVCCRKNVFKAIDDYQPKVIILLGKSALISVIGNRWKKNLGDIDKWRGFTIPDKDFKCWICPTFSSNFVENSEKEVKTVWEQDLKRALEKINIPLPKYKQPKIHIIKDLSILKDIKDIIAFDYETTGIKPHASGHRIVCCSVAINENTVYVFMMPSNRTNRKPFIDLLQNKFIRKMAHNIKYEDTWSVVRLRAKVRNWEWDSMLAAHILDNRSGVTGLKFQVYVNFGIVDYSSEIDPYLKAVTEKDGNSMNRIFELLEQPGGQEKLLEYCALDGIYQYRLALLQQEIIGYDFLPF